MERSTNYNMPAYNFTLWFFRLVVLMAITVLVLLFVLRINETVLIKQGEIVAVTPQADYKAPFEAEVVKIYIKEGQPVKAGDTLVVMKNADYPGQRQKTKTAIEYLEKKVNSFDEMLEVLKKRKAAISQNGAIAQKKYQLDIGQLENDILALDQQYSYQKERLSSANEKYSGDSILYKKEMLSRYEYNNTKDANITLREQLAAVATRKTRQLSEKGMAYNNFTKEQNALLLNNVQLEENEQEVIQARDDYQGQLVQSKQALQKIEAEVNKQCLLAGTDGIINYLFNTKRSTNLISKGELLVTIAPQTVAYYARLIVPERDMPNIKEGLVAHLRLDAYQHNRNGLIEGEITYVAERKENDKFYSLVRLDQKNNPALKPGYTLYGEIIVARTALFRYVIKKLFTHPDRT